MKIKGISISIVLASIYIFIFFAFSSGIINAMIEGSNFNFNNIIPSRSVQNAYETAIGVVILVFGFLGMLLVYKASGTPKLSEKYILIGSGLAIFTISIIFAYRIVEMKG